MPPPQQTMCTPWDVTWHDALNAACQPVGSLDTLTDDQKAAFLDNAMRYLWRATGRQYSTCPATVTTAYRSCCWHGRRRCRCCSGNRLDISWYGPPVAVGSVTVDGTTLTVDTQYKLVGSNLIRLGAAWSRHGTIVIEFTYGQDPDPDLLRACAILAVNDALRCNGSACAFPQTVTKGTVEGLTLEITGNDPKMWLDRDLSGIEEVDQIIHSIWPYGATATFGACDPAAQPDWDRIG